MGGLATLDMKNSLEAAVYLRLFKSHSKDNQATSSLLWQTRKRE
jgi:hypothetical protein